MISDKKGFTLIELLVVISIISVISSVILVSLSSARTKARFGAALQFSSSMYQSFGASAFAHWSFDDPTALGRDYSNNGYNLTTTGAPAAITNGAIRGAVNFDTTGEYYSFSTPAGSAMQDLNRNGGTISVFFRPSIIGVTNSPIFIQHVSNGGNRLYFSLSSTGNVQVIRGAEAVCCVSIVVGKTNANEWHHVALSWTSANVMIGYFDGKRIGQMSYTPGVAPDYFINLNIAKSQGVNTQFFGDIDEINVYNGVLADSEVNSLYLAGLEKINNNLTKK